MAVTALKKSKLRSALSVLGITIGIYCIVVVYALVHSMEKNINDNFATFGSDVLFVDKWPWDEFGSNYPWWKYMGRPETTLDESRFLEENLNAAFAESVGYTFTESAKIESGGTSLDNVNISAISHQFDQIQKVDVETGRYFSTDESHAGRPVCIIGSEVAANLFPNTSALGKEIRLKNRVCMVIGICRKEGQTIINASADEKIYVPVKFAMDVFGYRENRNTAQILVKAAPGVALEDLTWEVRQLMNRFRRIKPGGEETYSVNRLSMITSAVSDLFSSIRVIGIIIGGFSMVVGCFGVANIMYVSVKERTQEIGIQKALGATSNFILTQFLVESVMMCIAGGLIGMGLVWGTLKVFNLVLLYQLKSSVTLYLTFSDIMLGIVSSVLVGLIAGFLPARAGAAQNPVDAIRSK